MCMICTIIATMFMWLNMMAYWLAVLGEKKNCAAAVTLSERTSVACMAVNAVEHFSRGLRHQGITAGWRVWHMSTTNGKSRRPFCKLLHFSCSGCNHCQQVLHADLVGCFTSISTLWCSISAFRHCSTLPVHARKVLHSLLQNHSIGLQMCNRG